MKVVFSPDGRWVAASSAEWEAAIWDRKTGQLVNLFELPVGMSADNIAFAFSQDGGQFACSSGSEARRWNMDSGKLINSWKLPEGLVDAMAFTATGQLLLFRMENQNGRPLNGSRWQEQRRVCRVRDLLRDQHSESLYEIQEFSRAVVNAVIAPDGTYFVAQGLGGPEGSDNLFRCFDGRTGLELWQCDHLKPNRFSVDPTGKLLVAIVDEKPVLWEMPAGKELNPAEAALPGINGIGPRAEYYLGGSGSGLGVVLWRRSDTLRFATLGIDFEISAMPLFDAQGTQLALGTMDGRLLVYDLPEVRRRLAQWGLDW
jgi:WD40 repeat protein